MYHFHVHYRIHQKLSLSNYKEKTLNLKCERGRLDALDWVWRCRARNRGHLSHSNSVRARRIYYGDETEKQTHKTKLKKKLLVPGLPLLFLFFYFWHKSRKFSRLY